MPVRFRPPHPYLWGDLTFLLSTLLSSLAAVFTIGSAQPYIDAKLPVSPISVSSPYVLSLDAALYQPVVPLADVVPAASSKIAASTLTTNSAFAQSLPNVISFGVYGTSRLIVSPSINQVIPRFTVMYYGGLSSSGAVRTMTGSSSYSWGADDTVSGYYAVGIPVIQDGVTSNSGPANIIFTLDLPSGVYSYQLSGSVVVTTKVGTTTVSRTTQCSQEIFSSIDPIATVEIPLVVPNVTQAATAKSGTVMSSISFDLSNLSIYINQTADTVLLTLPSGQYLNSSGSFVSGSNVPAYTYLTQGLLGIGKDLMGTNGSITGVWNNFSTGMSFTATSIGELLRQSFRGVIGNLYYGDINTSAGFSDLLLSLDGSYSAMSQPTLAKILSNGLTGLSHNMEYSLTGGHRTSYSATFFSFGDDDSVLTKSEEEVTYSNLLEALVGIGQQLQQPLSQLQAVLANDDELELRQQTEPEVDAVIDGFTGEGQGAPSVSQIGDMANVSGDMSSLFDSGVGVDDFFTAMTTGDAFEFYSQETANDLDTTNAPAMFSVQDSDDFEGLVQDSDGFYSLADLSFFDLSLFLGKGG